MRNSLTETVATRGAEPPVRLRRETPTELVCLALVLALITLAGRILTIW